MRKLIALLTVAALVAISQTGICEEQKPPQTNQLMGITLLLADRAQVLGGLRYDSTYHWITKWNGPNDTASWKFKSPVAGDYSFEMTYSCPASSTGAQFEVSCGDSKVTGTVRKTTSWLDGWRNFERIPVNGKLHVPAGTNTITLRVTQKQPSGSDAMSFHILDMIPLATEEQVAIAATRERAKAMRSSTDWFVKAGYGLMFHWTTRTCPRRGPAKPFPEAVDAFDVKAFAQTVEETGAGYVFFFSSHADQFWPAPIQAVEKLLPGCTCKRDLIGEMADALNARGIKLMLYHIPSDIYQAAGSEPEFYDAYCNILTEVGERYGKKLAGYWFDFGTPTAPYERLTRAAKAGNPDRLVAWQSWAYPKLTDFQDYFGAEYGGSLTMPPAGYFDEGAPQAGLQPHGTVFLDDPWIHDVLDKDIMKPRYSSQRVIKYVQTCMEKKMVTTLNLGIYQDGTISPATLELLKAVKQAIRTP